MKVDSLLQSADSIIVFMEDPLKRAQDGPIALVECALTAFSCHYKPYELC